MSQICGAIHNWLYRVEVDQAVAYALASRVLQMITGPVTLLLIAHFFSPQLQGYYYTFSSLIALQSFVELGLYLVIINVASHEWVHLTLNADGNIVGESDALSRLVSLGRFIFKWYSTASLIFIIGVSLIGYFLFSLNDQPDIGWRAPWIMLVFVTGLQLLTMPYTSLLEGCNQVAIVNKFRTYQSGCSSLALWITISLGGGLWTVVALACVNLTCNLYLQLIRYRRFFISFLSPPPGPTIHWKMEIWPMQWRLGLSGVVNYFASALFTPVMFHYYGAIIAGQMGMTWQVLGALHGVAMAWVYTKVPRYGMFIAQKDYVSLDRLWLRCSLIALFVSCFGAVVVWLLVYSLNTMQIPFSQRLLSPLPTGLFLIAFILAQIVQYEAAYLRAHKQEPIVVASVTTCLLTGFSVWLLGSRFGPVGAAVGYLSVTLMGVIWITYIWLRCRTIWHSPNLKPTDVLL